MRFGINFELVSIKEKPKEAGWYCIAQDERPRDMCFFNGEEWSEKHLSGIYPKNQKIIHWLRPVYGSVVLTKKELDNLKNTGNKGFGSWL